MAQVELALPAGRAWTVVDADDAQVEIDGRRLVVRGWIKQETRHLRVAIDSRPLHLVVADAGTGGAMGGPGGGDAI